MITVMSKFPLRPGLTPEQALEEMTETIPWYRGREGCLRKQICLNWDERYGIGVYTWTDRARAEAFYAEATAEIERQTGAAPEIVYFETPVVADNTTGETFINARLAPGGEQ